MCIRDRYIATGSNMGDKKAYLDGAVEKLKNHPYCKVVKVSDYITTEPYGGVEQDVFLNGALEIKTLLYRKNCWRFLTELRQKRGVNGPYTGDRGHWIWTFCFTMTVS